MLPPLRRLHSSPLSNTLSQTSKYLATAVPYMPLPIDPQILDAFYSGHVAAITGAGSGIGRALALNLAKLGCDLALSDINQIGLDETKQLLNNYDVKATTTVLDVSDKEAVYAWADEVINAHGQVNFIFNNAGVALASTVEGMSIDELEWVMDINFWGVVYGTKAFLPLIKQSVTLGSASDNGNANSTGKQHGHIINISSLFGLTAQPTQSAYNASKFAVRGFTESLRQELDIQDCGVSATSVHPGGIKTNIAKTSRGNESITTLGLPSSEQTRHHFDKLLRFDPDMAAQVILMAAATNQQRTLIGNDAKVIDIIQRIAPSRYGLVFNKLAQLAKSKRLNTLQKLLKKRR